MALGVEVHELRPVCGAGGAVVQRVVVAGVDVGVVETHCWLRLESVIGERGRLGGEMGCLKEVRRAAPVWVEEMVGWMIIV